MTTPDKLIGSLAYNLLGDPRSSYWVEVEGDAANPQNAGAIVSHGSAPLQAARAVVLQVRRSQMIGPGGAIFLANDGFDNLDLAGGSLIVDGKDHYPDGTVNSNGHVVPAVTTQNPTVNKVVTTAVEGKEDSFQGLGEDFTSDPPVPSVLDLGGPSPADIDEVIKDILSNTDACAAGKIASDCVFETNDKSINADEIVGTQENPAIIHLTNTSGTTIKINGTWTGYGIIIAEGPLDFNGTAIFNGLVISRVDDEKKDDNKLNGDATIHGSFWSYGDSIKVGGNLKVKHSSQALEFADRAGLGSKMGGNLLRQLVVVGWDER